MREIFFLYYSNVCSNIPKSLRSLVVSMPFKKNSRKKRILDLVKQDTPLRRCKTILSIKKTVILISQSQLICRIRAKNVVLRLPLFQNGVLEIERLVLFFSHLNKYYINLRVLLLSKLKKKDNI